MTPFPRLTEIGDRARLVVKSLIPIETEQGPMAEFVFVGFEQEPPLRLNRLGVDGALLRMNFAFPAERGGTEPIIDYAGVAGEALVFERRAPLRGKIPTWRIEKAPTVAAYAPGVVAAATTEVRTATPPAPDPLGDVHHVVTDADKPVFRPPASVRTANVNVPTRTGFLDADADKRAVIHAAFERELAYVLGEPLKLVRKKKAEKTFDISAAVALLMIEQAKRGCL